MNEMQGGLRSVDGKPIPLRGVDVSGDVVGGTARIKVRQRYENVEKVPVEAIYVFPLPSEGTLVGFVMECEGRRIEGVCKELGILIRKPIQTTEDRREGTRAFAEKRKPVWKAR
jgi:Ca-activated chloride channel family protein